MDDNTLNWGILGCANIARKNCRAILLSKGNRLRGIASRTLATAESFLKDNHLDPNVTKIYGSYEELLNDSEIDAVYLPLPTTMHLEWAIKIAAAKKHILIEKPIAVNLSILKAIIAACEAHNVIFMDGVMFMHHSRMNLLRTLLSDPFTGNVKHVNSSFSFNGGEEFQTSNIRVKAELDPLGALGDLGWYCIRIGMIAFSNGLDYAAYSDPIASPMSDGKFSKAFFPIKVSARCNVWNDEKVPMDMEATIWFGALGDQYGNTADDALRCLRFDVSFLQPFRQCAEICAASQVRGVGDKVIRFQDFVIPRSDLEAKLHVETYPVGGPFMNFTAQLAYLHDEVKTHPCCQEAEMFTTFAAYHAYRQGGVLADTLPPESYWTQIALWTQATVDACMISMQLNGDMVAVTV